MIRPSALPLAVIGLAALTLGTAAVSYRLGHDAGHTEGQTAAHREADRTLDRLRAAFDGPADMPAAASAPEGRHNETTGDAP